jgi:hypothetical protein
VLFLKVDGGHGQEKELPDSVTSKQASGEQKPVKLTKISINSRELF